MWTTKAPYCDKVLLLIRTTPREEVKRRTEGMTLFLADLQRPEVTITPIPKVGPQRGGQLRGASTTTCVVDVGDRIGEEGMGFTYLLDGLNPERLMVAAEALGCGYVALDKAVTYAKERVVFGRPIGQNQGLAFPLAEAYNRLKAAELVLRQGTWRYDQRLLAVRRGRQHRQVALRRRRLPGRRPGHADPRRHRLRQGVPRRALLAGGPADADRADQPGDDPQLRRPSTSSACPAATDARCPPFSGRKCRS